MKPTKQKETAEYKVPIEFHADDFGMFPIQSRRILDCHTKGRLNGVSVMPNSEYLEDAMELLRPVRQEVAVTVHLNLIEGRSVSPAEEVPLLTDKNGIFRVSFGGLLLQSYLPGRKACREQLKKELRAQIDAVASHLEAGTPLRLDGHAHYHMLPVVFDALMDVIREEKLNVSYIRIPREYPSLYLRHWGQLQDHSAINLVKVLILNILSWRSGKKYPELAQYTQNIFLGVFLSGSMYYDNVEKILPDAIALAKQKNCGIEVLAHPGGVFEAEDVAQLTNAADVEFLTSQARNKEASLFLTPGTIGESAF